MQVNDIVPSGTEKYPIYFDRTEKDYSKWLELLTEALKVAKTFEYQFSYRMVGNILRERTGNVKSFGWGEVYCGHEIYHYGALGFPRPHFDLEFWVRLPKGSV